MAIAAMYSFLLDRHQAADIDGTLTVNILKVNRITNSFYFSQEKSAKKIPNPATFSFCHDR